MAVVNNRGKLVRWNVDKGFGFIKPDNGNIDIFIHISALRSMSRAPVIGDNIYYESGFDDSGRIRAINAKIEGVSEVMSLDPIIRNVKSEKTNYRRYTSNVRKATMSTHTTSGNKFILIVLIVIVGAMIYDKITNFKYRINDFQPITSTTIPKIVEPNFQCQGKVHCSEMTSYEEAIFYLQNCPGTKMDGDNDGEPCESQF